MPIFKYTVANQEGKRLSGTVEAPDETTARKELNNLGFSILALVETESISLTEVNPKLKKFIFESVDKNGKLVSGTIPAEEEKEALDRLEKEYSLSITAMWKENASEEEIKSSRVRFSELLAKKMSTSLEETKTKNLEEQKEIEFTKSKIETILKQVNEILLRFDKEFDAEQKNEISKRINKLLRIKSSNNQQYILAEAREMLNFLEKQQKTLQDKGFQEKEFELRLNTRKLLDELNRTTKPKTIKEDILNRINLIESKNKNKEHLSVFSKFFIKILLYVKSIFTNPPEIQVIKDQIKVYNKQLIEFLKLYFKEPTKEYKEKVKKTLGTIWRARKKAVHSLKYVKKLLKERRATEKNKTEEHLIFSFVAELNSLTGWLLFFYIGYYFVSLYLNTKDFGLTNIPKGFQLFSTHLFKYILVTVFLLHVCTSLKLNFFKKSTIANIILPTFFVFATIVTLLNF